MQIQAFLRVVLELVKTNRNLTYVSLDAVATRVHSLHRPAYCLEQEIGVQAALNRAKYWELSSTESAPQDWVEAMSRVAVFHQDGESVAVSTIYHILRAHPLLCETA
jgi:hypothetical protein